MPPQQQRYGGFAYGGTRLGRQGLPDGALTVPGYDAIYYWTQAGSSSAYGQAAYGGRVAFTYPAAGILAAPDPESGTVTIWAWWAYASEVVVNRVDPDGTRTPVRSSPIVLDAKASRRNLASNPKVRDATTNYSAGSNTTLSRLTALSTPSEYVTTALRQTAASAGTVSTSVTTDAVQPRPTVFSWWARTSAVVTDLQVQVRWYDLNSLDLGVSTYSVGATGRTQAVGAWSRVSTAMTSWPSDATVGVLTYAATGVAAGGTVDMTGRLTEATITVGDYFDGDFPASMWIGAVGLSGSDTSKIGYTIDAEAPLDTPIQYEIASARAPGFVASTTPVTVSGDLFKPPYDALLTHPGLAKTIPVWVETDPEITNSIEQGKFQVIGRRNKVVISAPQRGGDEGDLTFVVESLEQRTQLLAMLDDGSPLLLRSKGGYGKPPMWWLAFSDITVSPAESGTANTVNEVRRIKAPFVETDRPSAATKPLVA